MNTDERHSAQVFNSFAPVNGILRTKEVFEGLLPDDHWWS